MNLSKSLLALSIFLSFGSIAHGTIWSSTGDFNPQAWHGRSESDTSLTTGAYRAAINAAQGEAADVVAGVVTEPSPVFAAGAVAAAKLLKVEFKTDREAAVAIISLTLN